MRPFYENAKYIEFIDDLEEKVRKGALKGWQAERLGMLWFAINCTREECIDRACEIIKCEIEDHSSTAYRAEMNAPHIESLKPLLDYFQSEYKKEA